MSMFSVPLKVMSTALIVLSLSNCASVKSIGSFGDSKAKNMPPVVETTKATSTVSKKKKTLLTKLFNRGEKRQSNRSLPLWEKRANNPFMSKTKADQKDAENLDPIARAAFWGTRYNHDTEDVRNIVRFSRSLRQIGSQGESLSVMRKAIRHGSRHADIQLEFGKSLIANDRAFEAVRHLEKAITLGKGNDWRAYSAYGIALDQTGAHDSAQEQYDTALSLSPNNPTVLNNKGLSLALTGSAVKAEQTLRQAVIKPGASVHTRQNLALVLAIQGDVDAAAKLAKSDLAPSLASHNITFYRSMTAKPASWANFDAKVNDMPTFDRMQPNVAKEKKVRVKIAPSSKKVQKETKKQVRQMQDKKPGTKKSKAVQLVPAKKADDGSIVRSEKDEKGDMAIVIRY